MQNKIKGFFGFLGILNVKKKGNEKNKFWFEKCK